MLLLTFIEKLVNFFEVCMGFLKVFDSLLISDVHAKFAYTSSINFQSFFKFLNSVCLLLYIFFKLLYLTSLQWNSFFNKKIFCCLNYRLLSIRCSLFCFNQLQFYIVLNSTLLNINNFYYMVTTWVHFYLMNLSS